DDPDAGVCRKCTSGGGDRGQTARYGDRYRPKGINVAQSLVSEGGSATDLLANVPSLQVDMEGSVSLRGSGVRILIDGKPSAMGGSDITQLLQSMPANSIERIEVISNPSSKYDAE